MRLGMPGAVLQSSNRKRSGVPLHEHNEERGAELIEIAIGLPIFMAVLLVSLWLGLAANDNSALIIALNQAVDLASTRGDRSLVGTGSTGIIQAVHNYKNGAAFTSTLKQFLEVGEPVLNGSTAEALLNQWSLGSLRDSVPPLLEVNISLPA